MSSLARPQATAVGASRCDRARQALDNSCKRPSPERQTGTRAQDARRVLLCGRCIALIPLSALPALAVLLFVLGIARAAPVVAREMQGAADLLPSRYKGGWPQRTAARRAERARAAALAGTRYGSAVCEAVGGAITAAKNAVTKAATKTASTAVSGVTAAADALPSRFTSAWAQRAVRRKEERRRAADAAARKL